MILKYGESEPGKPVSEKSFGDLLWTTYLLSKWSSLKEIRFRGNPGMRFRPREVENVLYPSGKEKEQITQVYTNIGGLVGDSGPLPFWFEELLAQEDEDDAPVGDFLDIFSNRFIHLLFEAWCLHNPFVSYKTGGKDPISRIIFSILGMPDVFWEDQAEKTPKPARLLGYAGTLGARPRSAVGLQCILKSYFLTIPIRILEFVKRMVRIPQDQRFRLGSQGSMLGSDASLGNRVADVAGRFRIEIGALSLELFEKFLPGGMYHDPLLRLVRLYISYTLEWDVALKIKGDTIPSLCLGTDQSPGARLGYTSWLLTRHRKEDKLVFHP